MTLTLEAPQRTVRRVTPRIGDAALPALVLLAAAVLRFWDLGHRPGFEWDEPVYANIGTSVAHGDGIFLKPSDGIDQAPYLYHPPFYFLLLGAWFRIAGAGIAQARIVAAVASLAVLAMLYVLMRRRWGRLALVPLAVLATDGWLIFSNRISWIENTMLVLAVGGILAYDHARRDGRTTWFAAAGALLGAACIYKHLGAYLLVAVGIAWLVTRTQHRQHIVLFATAGAVVAVYLLAMLAIFGGDYVDATAVQLERLTGRKEARGSIGGTGQVLDAITGPYKIYATTLGLTAASGLLLARRVFLLARRRFAPEAAGDPLLLGWAAAAIVSFAAMGLKMGHYFMLILIPLYLFTAAEVIPPAVRLVRRGRAGRYAVLAAAGLLVAVNLLTYERRFVAHSDNALAAVQRYTDTHLPPHALVLTEESVGTMIRQPYCKFYRTVFCLTRTGYVIVYLSLTQAPPSDRRLSALVAASRPIARFEGWRELILVFRTPPTRVRQALARTPLQQLPPVDDTARPPIP